MLQLRSRRHLAGLAIFACGLSSCYRYTPAETTAVEPSTSVRITLSAAGTTRLAPVLGAGTSAVEGTVLSASDTGYRMSVTGTRKLATTGLVTWAGEQVTVPRDAIERVELRTLDRRRTTGLAVLGILAAVAVKVIVNAVDASAGGDDGGGGTVTPP